MNIDTGLASLSDTTFLAALVVYFGVLVLSIIALSNTSEAYNAPRRELVSIGGFGDLPGLIHESSSQGGFGRKCGRMGYALLIVAVFVQGISVIARGLATHRVPWGNMFEFINLATFAAMIVSVVIFRRGNFHGLIVFVVMPVVILMIIADTALYAAAGPVIPALQSYWLAVHVSAMSIGSGIFLFSGVCSALYLCKVAYKSSIRWQWIQQRLPTLETLDKYAYRTVVIAFPLFTLGIILGAVWAESAWGRYWGWDPKETGSFIAWVIYACYLHARATAGWKRTTVAGINILGFIAMLANLFLINLFTTGLHEYAGVN